MKITITIPDAFKGNSPMICIDSDTFTYSSPDGQHHGIQVERGVNEEDMLPHLDRLAEGVRDMLKKGLI